MSECHFWEVACKISETASKVSDDIVAKWAENIADGVNKTLVSVGTIWVNVGADVGSDGSVVSFIQANTKWMVLFLATGSIFVAAAQMAWSQKGEPLRDVMAGLIRLVVVSTAFPAITQMFIEIGDLYSPWIIQQAGAEDGGKFLVKILDMTQFGANQLGMIVIIVGGLIALLTNIVQIFLMFVRSGMLTLLAGFSPLSAAASTTKWGQQWFNKYIAWTMAFVAFKPTAATIYAVAIKLLSGDSYSFTDDIGKFLMGVIFLILAAVALPALVTFLVPVTANLGGGGGGGAMVAGALATGATAVARRALSKNGFGGGRGKDTRSSSKSPNGPTSTSAPTGAVSSPSAGGTGAASTGGAAAGGTGAAAAGGGAAAAGGPVGVAVAAGAKGVSAGTEAAKSTAAQTTGTPSGAPVAAPNAAGGPSGPSGSSGPPGPSGASGADGAAGRSGGGSARGAGSEGSQSTGAREVHR